MSTLDQARATHLRNIEAKAGKDLAAVRELIAASGLTKHGQIRSMLMETLGLGYGDANGLVHYALATDGQSAAAASGASTDDILDGIYTGGKASLRPIHEALMQAIQPFGDLEVVPKKGYVSLRRKRQFAMVGPAARGQVEVGLNLKDAPESPRLERLPPGGMCQCRVRVSELGDVNQELVGWVRLAYEAAG